MDLSLTEINVVVGLVLLAITYLSKRLRPLMTAVVALPAFELFDAYFSDNDRVWIDTKISVIWFIVGWLLIGAAVMLFRKPDAEQRNERQERRKEVGGYGVIALVAFATVYVIVPTGAHVFNSVNLDELNWSDLNLLDDKDTNLSGEEARELAGTDELDERVAALEGRVDAVEADLAALRTEFDDLTADYSEFKENGTEEIARRIFVEEAAKSDLSPVQKQAVIDILNDGMNGVASQAQIEALEALYEELSVAQAASLQRSMADAETTEADGDGESMRPAESKHTRPSVTPGSKEFAPAYCDELLRYAENTGLVSTALQTQLESLPSDTEFIVGCGNQLNEFFVDDEGFVWSQELFAISDQIGQPIHPLWEEGMSEAEAQDAIHEHGLFLQENPDLLAASVEKVTEARELFASCADLWVNTTFFVDAARERIGNFDRDAICEADVLIGAHYTFYFAKGGELPDGSIAEEDLVLEATTLRRPECGFQLVIEIDPPPGKPEDPEDPPTDNPETGLACVETEDGFVIMPVPVEDLDKHVAVTKNANGENVCKKPDEGGPGENVAVPPGEGVDDTSDDSACAATSEEDTPPECLDDGFTAEDEDEKQDVADTAAADGTETDLCKGAPGIQTTGEEDIEQYGYMWVNGSCIVIPSGALTDAEAVDDSGNDAAETADAADTAGESDIADDDEGNNSSDGDGNTANDMTDGRAGDV